MIDRIVDKLNELIDVVNASLPMEGGEKEE